MGNFPFSLNTFFKVMLVLTLILWVLWGLGNYMVIYGNPGILWTIIAFNFAPQVAVTLITLGIFALQKVIESGAFSPV